jgi:hypothetical protein
MLVLQLQMEARLCLLVGLQLIELEMQTVVHTLEQAVLVMFLLGKI